jgi:hypothetical protein
MTMHFMTYGYTQPRTITSIHVQEHDESDDVLDTLGKELADLTNEFDTFAKNVDHTTGDIKSQLKQVKDSLTMLENAGNHNTKVASDEFKKIEQAFERGHARIAALEHKAQNSITWGAAQIRLEKLEQNSLTRQEVQSFVNATRSRLDTIESTVLTDADVKTFVDNTRSRLSKLESDIKSLVSSLSGMHSQNRDLERRLNHLEQARGNARYRPGNFAGHQF